MDGSIVSKTQRKNRTTYIGVKLLGLSVVAGEAALAVGDVETTVDGTLEDTEDARTSGGADETNIEESGEGLGAIGELLNVVELTIDLSLALVLVVEVELLEQAAGSEETDSVAGGKVGVADLSSKKKKKVEKPRFDKMCACSVVTLTPYLGSSWP